MIRECAPPAGVLLALLLAGCRENSGEPGDPNSDAGQPDAGQPDASPYDAGPGTLDASPTDAADQADGSTSCLIWPNDVSSANSDPWLVQHHDEIIEMRPRVILINFDPDHTFQSVRDSAAANAAALAEGSRYHGYSNASAPKFLNYQIVHSVDLVGQVPANGASFDFASFFTGHAFADKVGLKDPTGNTNLTLCQAFERGFINEVWVGQGSEQPTIYEINSQAQVYDNDFGKIAGKFDPCAGNGCMEQVTCGVTLRVGDVNSGRGPGCATHAYGHALEGQVKRQQIPYFTKNAQRFFDFGMDVRYGTPFEDFYVCPYNTQSNCIDVVSPTHLTNGPAMPSGNSFDINNWGDGCGNVHFAPHSRKQYDYESSSSGITAKATCEGYGLGQGPGGKDAMQDIDYSVYQKLNDNPAYSDCGGGWQIYMRQSMPGYQNAAKAVDGKPMKNWWPFLFY